MALFKLMCFLSKTFCDRSVLETVLPKSKVSSFKHTAFKIDQNHGLELFLVFGECILLS